MSDLQRLIGLKLTNNRLKDNRNEEAEMTKDVAVLSNYQEFILTQTQRNNLELLYENSPKTLKLVKFDMDEYFIFKPTSYNVSLHDSIIMNAINDLPAPCGSVACFIGRGPLCGVLPDDGQSWQLYSINKFGVIRFSLAWTWLFDSMWSKTDNTLEGARKRLRIALDKGIPTNATEQLYGDVELEYEI